MVTVNLQQMHEFAPQPYSKYSLQVVRWDLNSAGTAGDSVVVPGFPAASSGQAANRLQAFVSQVPAAE